MTEFPFDSVLKRMSVIYRRPSSLDASLSPSLHVLTKGGFESVWNICDFVRTDEEGKEGGREGGREGGNEVLRLERASLPMWQAEVERLAEKGLRVLALAERVVEEEEGGEGGKLEDEKREEWEQGMVFLGLVGLMDPPRPEVRMWRRERWRERGEKNGKAIAIVLFFSHATQSSHRRVPLLSLAARPGLLFGTCVGVEAERQGEKQENG